MIIEWWCKKWQFDAFLSDSFTIAVSLHYDITNCQTDVTPNDMYVLPGIHRNWKITANSKINLEKQSTSPLFALVLMVSDSQ